MDRSPINKKKYNIYASIIQVIIIIIINVIKEDLIFRKKKKKNYRNIANCDARKNIEIITAVVPEKKVSQ